MLAMEVRRRREYYSPQEHLNNQTLKRGRYGVSNYLVARRQDVGHHVDKVLHGGAQTC